MLSVEVSDDAASPATPLTDSPAAASGRSDLELAASGVSAIHAPPAAPKQQKRKKKTDENLQQQLDEVSGRLESYKGRDEDECFSFSLVSHMRAVRPEQKLKMRAKMMEVLAGYIE